MKSKASIIQEDYYRKTADHYDAMHGTHEMGSEHNVGLFFLSSVIKQYNIQSILDIGSGTGRVISFINKEHPGVNILGIEPVKELREQAYKNGISPEQLIDGDGNQLNFRDGQFDLVCEFGVLHHVPNPRKVISEMMRVAMKYVFISDSNNFGQGNILARTIKQGINFMGLWKAYNYIRTKGKKYQISEGDGLFYSYSVFNNIRLIRRKCKMIYFLNTNECGPNLYKTAPHIVLLARKDI